MIEVIGSKVLFQAGNGTRKFLTMHELTIAHNGKERPYYMVARGQDEQLPKPSEKKPDAVIIVATLTGDDGKMRLVMTNEFRAPIGTRELSFPAGLIDLADGDSFEEAVRKAAFREFKEEVGLDLIITSVSPNLYSSAGMTNESVVIVFGEAKGIPTVDNNESTEDIQIVLLEEDEIATIIQQPHLYTYSKAAWPFLWAYKLMFREKRSIQNAISKLRDYFKKPEWLRAIGAGEHEGEPAILVYVNDPSVLVMPKNMQFWEGYRLIFCKFGDFAENCGV